jgi:hypothetical protein
VNLGSGEGEAAGLLEDLEALSFPLHDVVMADHAWVDEAADAVKILGSRTPEGWDFARETSEAAVVVGDKDSQHGVGGVQIASLSQAKFAGKAILQHAPEAFDAAFGLWTVSGDEGDAELLESPPNWVG